MRRVAKVLLGVATVALVAIVPATATASAATPVATASGCSPASNIEAIVDDSISMEFRR
jgi:hypothetical protein